MTLANFLPALFLGSFVGVMTGFFGAGGGFLLTPALNILLGLPMPLAVGTSSCQICGTSLFTLWQRLDRRWLGWRVAVVSGIGIVPGTWLGTRLVAMMRELGYWQTRRQLVPAADLLLLALFALLLLPIGIGMYLDGAEHPDRKMTPAAEHPGVLARWRLPPMYRFRTIVGHEFSLSVMVLLGGIMGLLSGLLGIGGGVIMLPMLLYLVGQKLEFATLTSTMIIFLSSLGSSFFHGLNGTISYPMALALLCGSLAGSTIGVRLQARVSSRKTRRYFAWVVFAAWLMVVGRLLMYL